MHVGTHIMHFIIIVLTQDSFILIPSPDKMILINFVPPTNQV